MLASSLNRGGACLVMLAGALLLGGCESTYYSAMEKLGVEKRDILVDRVEAARDSQEAAKEQFSSALEEFASVVDVDGGELEERYHRLSDVFEESERRAEAVKARIEAVERVSDALFSEWEGELDQYTSAKLRRTAERQLRATRRSYESMIGSMWRAEGKIAPVLNAFRDQVLFMKHNLNARAIASLRSELSDIETDTAALIREMEAAIAESNAFIAKLTG